MSLRLHHGGPPPLSSHFLCWQSQLLRCTPVEGEPELIHGQGANPDAKGGRHISKAGLCISPTISWGGVFTQAKEVEERYHGHIRNRPVVEAEGVLCCNRMSC
jgi:hypothetical protein